jgi:hypothetical protein
MPKKPLNPLRERPALFQNDKGKDVLATIDDSTTGHGGEEILWGGALCREHFFVVKQEG